MRSESRFASALIVDDLRDGVDRPFMAVLRLTTACDGPDAVTVEANPRDRYHRRDQIRRMPLRVT